MVLAMSKPDGTGMVPCSSRKWKSWRPRNLAWTEMRERDETHIVINPCIHPDSTNRLANVYSQAAARVPILMSWTRKLPVIVDGDDDDDDSDDGDGRGVV